MPNRTNWTGEKKEEFLTILKTTGNIAEAARALGLSRSRAYGLRAEDPEFAREWDDAVEEGVDNLEQEARRRAYHGVVEPVYYKGEVCGTVQRYSDTLMIVLLKAHRPEKYKERQEISGNQENPLAIQVLCPLPRTALDE